MKDNGYFELVKLQANIYCQLYVYKSEDKEFLNPIGFGSGFLVDYKGVPFLITADHILHMNDYEKQEERTNVEYNIAILNNVNAKDTIETALTPLSGIVYAEKFNLYKQNVSLIDVAICKLQKINFTFPFHTHEIKINDKIIVEAGKEKCFYDSKYFSLPDKNKKYAIYGVVKNDIIDGIRSARTNALYSNISYNAENDGYFNFIFPDEININDWEGISGAPIMDYEGNIVGVVSRVLGNGIWVTPIKEATILMDIELKIL